MNDEALTECCKTCYYWKQAGEDRGIGQCRFDPPKGTSSIGLFPLTRLEDWCGKWSRQEGE